MALLYHSDDDLTAIRPNIFSYGITDFEELMEKSESIINRSLEANWYRGVATNNGLDFRTTVFNPELLLNGTTQLVALASYKSLQLIYLFLMKEQGSEPDAFERQSGTFKKLYGEEMKEVLDAGLDYDWSDDGNIDAGENIVPRIRRLERV